MVVFHGHSPTIRQLRSRNPQLTQALHAERISAIAGCAAGTAFQSPPGHTAGCGAPGPSSTPPGEKNATRLFATKKTQGNTCPKTRTVAKESPRADLDLKWPGRFSAPGRPEMFTLQLSSCAARRWEGDWDRQRIIGGSFKGDDHRICGTHLRHVGGSQHVTGRLAYIIGIASIATIP